MNTIIPRLTEFENDIKLLKKAILVLENNFSKIKNDIIETCNEESNHINIKINKYLIEKNLIKNKKVYLNKELKTLLKTKKRIIELDEILKFVINCNVV